MSQFRQLYFSLFKMLQKFKNILCQETTYQTDYTTPKLTRLGKADHGPLIAEKEIKTKTRRPKDVQTLQFWNDVTLIPQEILEPIPSRMQPKFTFEKIVKPEDPLKQESIRTRPREVMTPAISIDDITDQKIREIICADMYASTIDKLVEPLNLKVTERIIANTTFEQNANYMQTNYSTLKIIRPDLRRKGKVWEPKQIVKYTDRDVPFWRNYKHRLNTTVGIDPLGHTVSEETKKEIRDLVEKDELSMGYDRLKPGYAGYRPRYMIEPLRKAELRNANKKYL